MLQWLLMVSSSNPSSLKHGLWVFMTWPRPAFLASSPPTYCDSPQTWTATHRCQTPPWLFHIVVTVHMLLCLLVMSAPSGTGLLLHRHTPRAPSSLIIPTFATQTWYSMESQSPFAESLWHMVHTYIDHSVYTQKNVPVYVFVIAISMWSCDRIRFFVLIHLCTLRSKDKGPSFSTKTQNVCNGLSLICKHLFLDLSSLGKKLYLFGLPGAQHRAWHIGDI